MTRAPLTPGNPTPIRSVPAHIERPEYAWKDSVQENVGEPWVQTPETIEKMREASRIAADARDMLGGVGILLENDIARHFADIEAMHTYEGTDTVQSLIMGRRLTGHSAFGWASAKA